MELWFLQDARRKTLNETAVVGTSGSQGLAGRMLRLMRSWRGQRGAQHRQLRLVETLPLGGKRQLMLITCAGESFLVGGGLESVETIVRLKAEVSTDVLKKSLDEPWQ